MFRHQKKLTINPVLQPFCVHYSHTTNSFANKLNGGEKLNGVLWPTGFIRIASDADGVKSELLIPSLGCMLTLASELALPGWGEPVG